MNKLIKEIKDHYKDNRLIPFIGAGFSIPLGLPSWNELIGWIANKLDFEKELFHLHGSPQQLAEYLEKSNPTLYSDFIHHLGLEFNSKDTDIRREKSELHKILASMNLKTIYTTNYDHHIEEAIKNQKKDFNRLATLSDFLNSKENNNCEVIKFHGTLEQPETIILTETRYFDRMALEEAVDQRLRSDLLSNSFLFMGYGFNDPNLRYVWYRINKLREQSDPKKSVKLRPSYFTAFGISPIQQRLLKSWEINVLEFNPIDPISELTKFLKEICS